MKKLYIFLVLIAVSHLVFAQTEAELFKRKQLANKETPSIIFREDLLDINLSKIWTQTENKYVYGFIGNDYQRIRIKFITVTKSKSSPDSYDVYGKSMVKNNVDEFHGSLKLTNVRKLKTALSNKDIKGQYCIVGDYLFNENKNESHSGTFKGAFVTWFYLDKNNNPHYDDIDKEADSFTNNEFVGQWQQYNSNIIKRCNWGDYRIPNSGHFDIGAGDFSPDDQYLKYGWQSVRDMWNKDKQIAAKAKAIEEAKWWK